MLAAPSATRAAKTEHPARGAAGQHARPHTANPTAAAFATATGSAVQRQLEIGAADDPLEREANRIADAVLRRCPCGGMPGPDGECAACKEQRLRLSRTTPSPTPAIAPPIVDRALSSPGRPLDARTRAYFEPRLGADLAAVRVHDDATAAASASAVNANAYTVGDHIVFAAGRHAPATPAGDRLLAHELAHVLQSSGDTVRRLRCQGPVTPQAPGVPAVAAAALPAPAATGALLAAVGGLAAGAPTGTAGPTCTPAPPTFIAGPKLLFEFDSTALVPGQGPLLASLLADARCASTVAFHGNASSEGSPSHNQTLACNRAMTLATLFSGLPPLQSVLAHGATSAFSSAPPSPTSTDPNRNVVVVMGFPTSPPPLPSSSVTPPSAIPAPVGAWTPVGGCGAGDDSLSADFPPVSSPYSSRSGLLILAADSLPDFELEAALYGELVVAAGGGAPGATAWARFNTGTGGTAVHAPGSTLSAMMAADPHFLTPALAVAAAIESQARTQVAAGALDYRLFGVTAPHIYFPPSSIGFGSGVLASVLGGTQGTHMFILNFMVLPCTRNYMAILRFVVCDDFGVDQGDVKSPGLAAFWVLQHRRPPGHVAFINEVTVDLPITGSF
jgi:outer membrane protein OmpA-like peptidoglycan-associated protein